MTQMLNSSAQVHGSTLRFLFVRMARCGLAVAIATLILTVATGTPADAKQTSVDKRIFEVYEGIDDRTRIHESDSARIRQQLERKLEQFEQELSTLDTPAADLTEAEQKQHSLERTARLTLRASEYLNLAHTLVDSAASVISRNLTDLATLAEEVRKTDDGKGGITALEARIQKNVAAGRAMRLALNDLASWAREDPRLAGKFNSMQRVMHSLDRRIGIDQVRLQAQRATSGGPARSRLDAIDQAVDRLADFHVEIDQERQAIIDARNDVKMLIALGRQEVTGEIAKRAIPRLAPADGSAVGIPGLKGIVDGIGRLTNRLLDAPIPVSGENGAVGRPGPLNMDEFRNF